MEKRYQVFISSTFQDLQPARQEVSQALLRADCFPAGMELFPAADEEQFEFIKQIIDQSDYYIIISAGRYGSIHPETGLSYTEMEYDYAVETGKPVIPLLQKDPSYLFDEDGQKTDNLLNFRKKLGKSNLVRFWSEPNELGAEVTFALLDLKKRYDAVGWVRADHKAVRKPISPNSLVTNYPSNERISKSIFLSYSFSDIAWADWIGYQLKGFGHRVRRPQLETTAGTNWRAGISEAIASSDIVISILSENQNPNVMLELGIALAMSDSKTVVPVMVKKTSLPSNLARYQVLDLSNCREHEARAVLFGHFSGVPESSTSDQQSRYSFPGRG